MTDLNSDIEEVIKNLKLSEKKSLNNIYLQLIDEKDENTFINLDTGEITKDLSHNNYGLIIKMSIKTTIAAAAAIVNLASPSNSPLLLSIPFFVTHNVLFV